MFWNFNLGQIDVHETKSFIHAFKDVIVRIVKILFHLLNHIVLNLQRCTKLMYIYECDSYACFC